MRFTPAIVTALLLATGCVGGIENTDPPPATPDAGVTPPSGSMARQMFTTNVHPIVMRCSGGACHSVTGAVGGGASRFADSSPDTSYDAIVRQPLAVGGFNAQAGFLTKIAGGHQAITYSTAEISSINAWFAQELKEKMGTGMPPAVDPIEVLKKWSGCMTLANFNTAQMAQKWGGLAASQGQKCANCHALGGDSFIATTNAQTMFDMMTKYKDYLLKFFTVDGTGKVIINKASMVNAGVTIPSHPRFDPTTNAGMQALEAYYTATLPLFEANPNTCEPPRLLP
ncbi:MAG: hypothetical protein H0T46_20310 [Deltaproteobacteria bacterium]|nr:hypothetical protein [Deltaproteobacteria bacterium]